MHICILQQLCIYINKLCSCSCSRIILAVANKNVILLYVRICIYIPELLGTVVVKFTQKSISGYFSDLV